MAAIDLEPERLLKLRDVQKITTLGSTTIYRMMDEGRFPRPIRLGPGTVRWRWSVLEQWIEERPTTDKPPSR